MKRVKEKRETGPESQTIFYFKVFVRSAPLERGDALVPPETVLRVQPGGAVALAALEVADDGAADIAQPVFQAEGGDLGRSLPGWRRRCRRNTKGDEKYVSSAAVVVAAYSVLL